MSDPRRWKDDAGAPDGARALLAKARGSRPIPREARARSAARLDRIVALPAAAGVGLWLKGLALAAGIGTATAVVAPHVLPVMREDHEVVRGAEATHVRAPASAPMRAARAKVEPVAEESRESLRQEASPVPEEAAPPPPALPSTHARVAPSSPRAAAPAIAANPAPQGDALAREAAMLEAARASLAAHPADALALLDAHAAAFPAGQLAMERELLAVDALQRLGRVAQARTRGAALLERARGSIYEARARRLVDALAIP